MKKTIYTLVVFLSIAITVKAQSNLKVITYNIWNGFEWDKDVERKAEFMDWINEQNPDVFALQELCGYTQQKLEAEAKKWGHPYAVILKEDGYPVGLTSKKPIVLKEKIREGMSHGGLHCQTYGIDFFVVHFSPASYKKRHEEAQVILNKLSEVSKQQNNYIVLGDFNALSPFDAHLYKDKPALITSKKASEEEHTHVRNLFHGELEFGVISKFLGDSLIDVTQRYIRTWNDKVSFPTQVFEEKKGEGRSGNSQRIDYILVSPEMADLCIYAKVINTEETFYLSDHYPVIAEFNYSTE